MRLAPTFALMLPIAVVVSAGSAWSARPVAAGVTQQDPAAGPGGSTSSAPLPRGKKLMLKDGSYQLVRDYEKNGERVRYFSVERGGWEEIPASLVDWDATKKAEAADEKTTEAMLEKVRIQEAAKNAQTPVDVDASLTVAPGVFLPDGEGMFALEGKSIKRIEQAGSQVSADKKTVLKQVLSPIPIVPSKHNIELPGAKAAVRLTSQTPEFYLREPPPDPNKVSSLDRTGRQDMAGPDVVLVHAKVKGNKRLLESIRSLFGTELSQDRVEVSMQRWEVAPDIYRFTLSEPLPPGEYALTEILDDGLNLFVWDFGVDAVPAEKTNPR
ncbi:MAG: hypothetical protein ABSH39_12430 [Candidatus Acidiferrum sp.]